MWRLWGCSGIKAGYHTKNSLFRAREALWVPDQPVQQALAVLHKARVFPDKILVMLQERKGRHHDVWIGRDQLAGKCIGDEEDLCWHLLLHRSATAGASSAREGQDRAWIALIMLLGKECIECTTSEERVGAKVWIAAKRFINSTESVSDAAYNSLGGVQAPHAPHTTSL